MTGSQRRGVSGLLLSHRALPLVLVAAVALVASGCQGLAVAVPPEQGAGVSARAGEEDPATATAEPTSTSVPTAEPTSTSVPTAEARPTRTPTPSPTATPSPATQAASTPAAELRTGPVTGRLAPDLTLPALNGDEVTLSSLRGKVVLLNFWTTW